MCLDANSCNIRTLLFLSGLDVHKHNSLLYVLFVSVFRNLIFMGCFQSIGSKSLNWCKKVGVKFSDIFLWIEWLERNFGYFAITLPLDFPEIFNIFEITAYFIFRLIWGCDVIKFFKSQTRRVTDFCLIPYCRRS